MSTWCAHHNLSHTYKCTCTGNQQTFIGHILCVCTPGVVCIHILGGCKCHKLIWGHLMLSLHPDVLLCSGKLFRVLNKPALFLDREMACWYVLEICYGYVMTGLSKQCAKLLLDCRVGVGITFSHMPHESQCPAMELHRPSWDLHQQGITDTCTCQGLTRKNKSRDLCGPYSPTSFNLLSTLDHKTPIPTTLNQRQLPFNLCCSHTLWLGAFPVSLPPTATHAPVPPSQNHYRETTEEEGSIREIHSASEGRMRWQNWTVSWESSRDFQCLVLP